VASLAPAELQGGAQGLSQAVTGAGVLVAGLWAGAAWNGTGSVPLVVAGTVGALAAVGLFLGGSRLEVPVPA
jgi:hypothetical protein